MTSKRHCPAAEPTSSGGKVQPYRNWVLSNQPFEDKTIQFKAFRTKKKYSKNNGKEFVEYLQNVQSRLLRREQSDWCWPVVLTRAELTTALDVVSLNLYSVFFFFFFLQVFLFFSFIHLSSSFFFPVLQFEEQRWLVKVRPHPRIQSGHSQVSEGSGVEPSEGAPGRPQGGPGGARGDGRSQVLQREEQAESGASVLPRPLPGLSSVAHTSHPSGRAEWTLGH